MDKEKFLKSEAAFMLIRFLHDGELAYDEDGGYVVSEHYNVNHPDISSLVTEEDKEFFLSLSPDDITGIYINETSSRLYVKGELRPTV